MSFRSTLQRELPQWVEEGLVRPDQAEALRQRCALGRHGEGTSGLLLPAVYLVGACLVGGGAISFVAAHWDALAVALRVALLVAALLACEGAGFYLWKVSARRPRLGEALVVLGSLVFGANVFLIAQMYHLHGPAHQAFGVWALGALAVAYATASGPALVVACLASVVWAAGWIDAHPHDFCWYPFALGLAAAPYLRRHSVLALVGVLFAGGVAAGICARADSDRGWPVLLMLPALGAFGRGLGLYLQRSRGLRRLAWPPKLLGGAALLIPAYILSYHQGREDSVLRDLWTAEGWWWTALLALVYLGAAAAWAAAWRRPSAEDEPPTRWISMLAAAALVTCGVASGHAVVLAAAANLALLGVAASLLHGAVALGRRGEFWQGLLLLALVVVSRFFEWDTHLMVKSAVFVLCGLGVMLGGVRFEKRLKGGGR